MKIVNIVGGLGNQMFQCALSIALKNEYPNEEVYIDTSHFNYIILKKLGPVNMHNGYEIDSLFKNFNIPIASRNQIAKVAYYVPNFLFSRIIEKRLPPKKTMFREKRNYEYCSDVFKQKGDTYYDGYWQCSKYFEKHKNEILEAFNFPKLNAFSKKKEEELVNCESVAIHVRRGDYLKDPEFGGICGLGYFSSAILKLKEELLPYKFYIFSNDTKWCEENLAPLLDGYDICYMEGNRGKDSVYDMYLMSKCKHMIISNSSFSWWGAFFNCQGGKIIAPKPWVDRDGETDIYGKGWIVIDSHDKDYRNYRFDSPL